MMPKPATERRKKDARREARHYGAASLVAESGFRHAVVVAAVARRLLRYADAGRLRTEDVTGKLHGVDAERTLALACARRKHLQGAADAIVSHQPDPPLFTRAEAAFVIALYSPWAKLDVPALLLAAAGLGSAATGSHAARLRASVQAVRRRQDRKKTSPHVIANTILHVNDAVLGVNPAVMHAWDETRPFPQPLVSIAPMLREELAAAEPEA